MGKRKTGHWPTMDTYPACDLDGCTDPKCDWGPTTLLSVDSVFGELIYVGHKEAGMWIVNTGDGEACDEITPAPSRWHPLP